MGLGSGTVDRYDSALAYCDDQLGRLLGELASRKEWEKTAVVVYSDHGELFGERGFMTHGYALLSEGPTMRTVLALRIPGVAPKTIRTNVSLTDLAPTMIALSGKRPQVRELGVESPPARAGGDADAGEKLRSPRAASLPLRGHAAADDADARARSRPRAVPVFARCVRPYGGSIRVDRDPGETVNLVAKEPALRAELSALVDSWESQGPD